MDAPRIGIAAIVIRDGTVLLGKRRGSHGAGTWGFPGGHLETGEDIEQCVAREVLEETGLRAYDIRHAGFTNDVFKDEGKHYVTLFVTAKVYAGDAMVLEPHRCERWEWHAWDGLPEPLFLSIRNLKEQGYRLPNE
jgi:8-oxo-dGTP diphosphatase